jgi:hypothetical protein
MAKATFTKTAETRSAGATFTHDDPPSPFGWQGEKHARRAAQAPPRASVRSLGNVEPGRLAEFEQGRREAFDARARTAAVMVGTYAAVKAAQHWRAWRRQRGR